MKLSNKKIGFTLIELLVVITIIGILATGAVGIYTTQIKKARDSTRTTDIKALETAVMQFYQDKSVYPNTYVDWISESGASIKQFVQVLPEDPKHGQTCLGSGTVTTVCAYEYSVGKDTNGIKSGAYKLSIGFEDAGNLDKSANDNFDSGINGLRYELWAGNKALPTSNNAFGTVTETTTGDIGEDDVLTIFRGKVGKIPASNANN